MALSKIYIGSTLIMDGNDIANAIGSEVSNASTFTELVNAINTNKTSLAVNLTGKSITAFDNETLSSLVSKVANIIVNDLSGIRSSIGSELSSNANVSDIVNAITSDKQILINMLIDFGISADINETFSNLINKFNGIVATRFRYATDSVIDVSFVVGLAALLDSAIALLNTPALPTPSDDVEDISFLSDLFLNDSAGNTLLETILTALMISNTAPSGIVSASSIYNSTYDAWKAFNRSNSSDDCWITDNNVLIGWLCYQFITAKMVNRYELYPRNESSTGVNSFPKSWTFEASADGLNWTVLDIQTNQSVVGYTPDCFKSYSINNTELYAYYRINITDNNGNTNYTSLGELRLAQV